MENISLALCAHVDAGKTTLSEAMLFEAGAIRKKGRVDHGDAFLDTDPIERERGITIFSKLAIMELGERRFTLMDTPGHVDFSAEAERTLAVADGAVLVVSATEPVQGHTRTLWGVLRRFDVPTVIFVNKMDLPGADRAKIMRTLSEGLSPACADFGEDIYEAAAMADEEAMEKYLAGKLTDSDVARLVGERRLFPVAFGSALHGEGVDKLLRILSLYMPAPEREAGFAASAYKIGRDPSGTRLTYLKLSGGTLRVKDSLDGEKCDQIREYSGEKYTLVKEAAAGAVVAVTGLEHSFAGKTYGIAPGEKKKLLRPVIRYSVELPEGADPNAALAAFRKLEEEEPQLSVGWDQEKSGISLSLMGEVQLEVIERVVRERFGITAKFTGGGIVYRETIRNTVEGVGHFEPLRHYAEVHLILEPDERGSGLTFASTVPEDELDRNWQRLILTHLSEKQHLGVLTGSPITDMRITLAAGRAHLKHTEGGDFREATYRAVRQGLTLELPAENVGRALSDLTRMEARTEAPELGEDGAVIRGSAPASELHGYDTVLASYTRGRGRLSAAIRGYEECHNAEKVIGEIGYDPERDPSNSPDSVFCSHGAGHLVRWDEADAMMHVSVALINPQRGRRRTRSFGRYSRRPTAKLKGGTCCQMRRGGSMSRATALRRGRGR